MSGREKKGNDDKEGDASCRAGLVTKSRFWIKRFLRRERLGFDLGRREKSKNKNQGSERDGGTSL